MDPIKTKIDAKLIWIVIAFLILQTLAGLREFNDVKTRVTVNETRYDNMAAAVTEIKGDVKELIRLARGH